MIKRTFLALFTGVIFMFSCSSDDTSGGTDNQTDNFDRSAMLVNWADNIIIPVYEDLNSKLEILAAEKEVFIAEPTPTNLFSLRTAWQDAYKVWQYAEMFNVGMAENINYIFQMNVYPTNVQDIQNNIESQDYDLSSVNNNDAVGFPALDYMLYGVGSTETEVVDFYTTSASADKRKIYLSDLTDRMQSLTQTVLEDWKNGYRDTFVSSTDNTATGSINLVVNDFIYYYEKGFRANKFGIPAGVFSQNPLPDRVEAYYTYDFSKVLALEAMTAVQDFFNGRAYQSGSDGRSLADYLNSINGSEDLSTSITSQYAAARTKINTLNDSFAEQVNTNNVAMTETFDSIQLAVVLLKVDMLQALDISVDYVDADGD
ncbi:imelysin family protein [Psychroflexus aurantiacus]|uniref:imelysin family protein n=1 Tax=Psychroflexus aurantiacus TaxID=2709310 RepID=UPI0019689F4C|nr:imelysin family protein [Psychroflexus aurantiacus]